MTHARNNFYLAPSGKWFTKNLASDEAWKDVESLLRRYRLIQDVQLTKSGQPETFLHVVGAPDRILQARVTAGKTGTNESLFWQELIGVEG